MTDQEISELRGKNASRFSAEKDILYQEYLKMDEYLLGEYNKNAIHQHFKTKKEMQEAMARDFNPFNTFSFGRKKPPQVDQG